MTDSNRKVYKVVGNMSNVLSLVCSFIYSHNTTKLQSLQLYLIVNVGISI
jgi:hypothetical protein